MQAQTPPPPPRPARGAVKPPAPREIPHRGYEAAKDLPDGTIPSAKEDGNFVLGPTHTAAPR